MSIAAFDVSSHRPARARFATAVCRRNWKSNGLNVNLSYKIKLFLMQTYTYDPELTFHLPESHLGFWDDVFYESYNNLYISFFELYLTFYLHQ